MISPELWDFIFAQSTIRKLVLNYLFGGLGTMSITTAYPPLTPCTSQRAPTVGGPLSTH